MPQVGEISTEGWGNGGSFASRGPTADPSRGRSLSPGLAAHSSTPHFRKMGKALKGKLAGRPELHMLQRSKFAPPLVPSPGSVISATTTCAFVRIDAKPGRAEEAERALATMVGPSNAEPGCLMYELFTDPKIPDALFFVEAWQDQAAIEAHGKSAHMRALGPTLRGLLAGRPQVQNFKPLAAAKL